MFKRLILIAVALLMLLGTAFAEGLPAFEPYTAALSAPEGAEWKEDGDLRVMNLENDIQIHVCLIDENIAALTVVAPGGNRFFRSGSHRDLRAERTERGIAESAVRA